MSEAATKYNSMPATWCAARVAEARAYEADLDNPPRARQHIRELLSQLDKPAAPPTDTPAPTGGDTSAASVALLGRTMDYYQGYIKDHETRAAQLLTRAEKAEAEATTLRARLQEETRAAAETEREKFALIRELQGLRADVKGFRESMLADLKEAYGQGDWLNIHFIIEELKAENEPAALPLQGEDTREEVAGE